MKTQLNKGELLSILTTNREQHQGIFDEAVEGYRKEAVLQLEAHIERIKRGDMVRVSVSLPLPENHTADYDRVIKMVKMDNSALITLAEEEFAQYVMDDWHWKRQFLASTIAYSQTARRISEES